MQLLSQLGSVYNCLSRSIPEVHWHVAGTLSGQQTKTSTEDKTVHVFKWVSHFQTSLYCTYLFMPRINLKSMYLAAVVAVVAAAAVVVVVAVVLEVLLLHQISIFY